MTKKPDNTSSYFPCVLSRKHFNLQICWVKLKEKFKISEARKEHTGKKKKKRKRREIKGLVIQKYVPICTEFQENSKGCVNSKNVITSKLKFFILNSTELVFNSIMLFAIF